VHHSFWHDRWAAGQIGFHQADFHALLERFWPRLGVPGDARVYVPLCGKSLDMVWLAQLGHRVVGSELSSIAIRDFFAEQELEPQLSNEKNFRRHAAGPYEILEGDALELAAGDIGPIDAAYDRAALIALPPPMRRTYATRFAGLLPVGARALLLALEYPQEMKSGPPFSVPRDEIDELYGTGFSVEELARIDVIAESPKFAEFGIDSLFEVAYALTRKA